MARTLSVILLALLLAACGGGDEAPTVTVFTAASLTDTVGKLNWDHEQASGVRVNLSPGASSALARQIKDGAPAHVFVSADRGWIDYLQKHGRLDGEPQLFARNALVCVVKTGVSFRSFEELADAQGIRIAIADAGVPAGEYAREAMENAGVAEALRPKLVAHPDVYAVLNAVMRGEAEAGFVYATDAREGTPVGFAIDAGLHKPIEVWIARIKGAPPETAAYMKFMLSDAARTELTKRGFR